MPKKLKIMKWKINNISQQKENYITELRKYCKESALSISKNMNQNKQPLSYVIPERDKKFPDYCTLRLRLRKMLNIRDNESPTLIINTSVSRRYHHHLSPRWTVTFSPGLKEGAWIVVFVRTYLFSRNKRKKCDSPSLTSFFYRNTYDILYHFLRLIV